MSDNSISNAPLLPSHSTQLEKDLDSLFDYSGKLEPAVNLARTAKLVDIQDNYVPWLVYEYGLEEVLPWITDPKEAMRSGIQWQRIKGTPESLRIALSWVGFVAEKVEQEETGAHFYEFQIQIDGVPEGRGLIDSIVALSRLSAPLRSRLSRLYNSENDVRRFKLDSSDWGDILSDYSGVRDESGTRLSFGRRTVLHTEAEDTPVSVGIERRHDMSFKYHTGHLLDSSDWGEVPILESSFILGRLAQFSNEEGLQVEQEAFKIQTLSKSGLVLSGGEPLGGTHNVLSGALELVETGDTFVLSGSRLSDVPRDIKLVNVDERIDNTRSTVVEEYSGVEGIGYNHDRLTSVNVGYEYNWPVLSSDTPEFTPYVLVERQNRSHTEYKGQIWAGAYWDATNKESWESINVIIGVNHVSSS